MKIIVSKNDLRKSLNLAQNVLGSSFDITSHFIFSLEDGVVKILSCEPPRLFSSVVLDGSKIEGNGQFTIDGKKLLQVVNATNDDDVLTITYNSGVVKIKTSLGTLSFSSLDPKTFPSWLDFYAQAQQIKVIDTTTLSEALNAVKPFISVDETRRPELCQAVILNSGDCYATDAFSICMVQADALKDFTLKVHFKDYPALIKFLKTYTGYDVTIKETDKSVFFECFDGGLLGIMKSPFEPFKVPNDYFSAFTWTPRRAWVFSKESINQAINYLSAGADKGDLVMTFEHDENSLSEPILKMDSASGDDDPLIVSLPTIQPQDNSEYPLKMYFDSINNEDKSSTLNTFKFNYLNLKKSIESLNSQIVLGANSEKSMGYILLRDVSNTGLNIASIIAWVK